MGKLLRAMLVNGPHKQGGHSAAGLRIAQSLGIPFPLTMESLEAKAIELGYDPAELWPWRDRKPKP